MSQYDYIKSIELYSKDFSFFSIIIVAMRKADDVNLLKLKNAFPELYAELQLRYNSPDGQIESDLPDEKQVDGEDFT